MSVSPVLFIALSLAGGVGAACRFLLDGAIRSRTTGDLPWGTIAINLSGSFALGALAGLVSSAALPPQWLLVVGTGFLGGYTTFSTASYETVRLIAQGSRVAGVVNGLGQLLAATLAAGVGYWLGSG